MHCQFLEVIKNELDSTDVMDINNVQALIFYNIGGEELTVGELILWGYYLGSNVSYNVKKITENGYLHHEWSSHDRRSVRVKLTEKGLEQNWALETIFERHSDQVVDNLGPAEILLAQVNEILRGIEGFWLQQPGFGLHASEFSRVETAA